jgi:hypothetical protein
LPVCTAFLVVGVAACNRSCSAPAPSAFPDAQSIAVVSFDEVTDEVWDVDARDEGGDVALLTGAAKTLCRSAIRHAMGCVKGGIEVAQNQGQLPVRFSIGASIRIGPGERVHLLPDSGSAWLSEPLLRRMSDCLESEFRAMGVFRHTGDSTLILHWNPHFERIGGEE